MDVHEPRSVRPERRVVGAPPDRRPRRRSSDKTAYTRPACRSRVPATRTEAARTTATYTETETMAGLKTSSVCRDRCLLEPSASYKQ